MTVTTNIHEAKTTLSKLIERALAGEEVVIAKAGKPVVRLTPVAEAKVEMNDRLAIFGKYQGKVIIDENWEESEFDDDMLERFYSVDSAALMPNVAETPAKFDDE